MNNVVCSRAVGCSLPGDTGCEDSGQRDRPVGRHGSHTSEPRQDRASVPAQVCKAPCFQDDPVMYAHSWATCHLRGNCLGSCSCIRRRMDAKSVTSRVRASTTLPVQQLDPLTSVLLHSQVKQLWCCRFLELKEYILKRREELSDTKNTQPRSAASKGFS